MTKNVFNTNYTHLNEGRIKTLNNKGLLFDSLEDIGIAKNGTLVYKNIRVLLHIGYWLYQNEDGDILPIPRLHISNCTTVKGMRKREKEGNCVNNPSIQNIIRQNKLCRYSITTKDDGYFVINKIIDSMTVSNVITRLNVCKHCLEYLNWDGYSTASHRNKLDIFNKFTLNAFFEKYPKSLFPNGMRQYK